MPSCTVQVSPILGLQVVRPLPHLHSPIAVHLGNEWPSVFAGQLLDAVPRLDECFGHFRAGHLLGSECEDTGLRAFDRSQLQGIAAYRFVLCKYDPTFGRYFGEPVLVRNTRLEVIGMALHLFPCFAQGIGDLFSTQALVGEEGVEYGLQAARSVSQRITSSIRAIGCS